MNKNYVIAWECKHNGFRGEGKVKYNEETIKEVILELNSRNPEIHHWAKSVENPNKTA